MTPPIDAELFQVVLERLARTKLLLEEVSASGAKLESANSLATTTVSGILRLFKQTNIEPCTTETSPESCLRLIEQFQSEFSEFLN